MYIPESENIPTFCVMVVLWTIIMIIVFAVAMYWADKKLGDKIKIEKKK
jgi:hypothetical protein